MIGDARSSHTRGCGGVLSQLVGVDRRNDDCGCMRLMTIDGLDASH